MNSIDRIFMKPLIKSDGKKIELIELDENLKYDLESIKRVYFILGEPLNTFSNNKILYVSLYFDILKKNPYI